MCFNYVLVKHRMIPFIALYLFNFPNIVGFEQLHEVVIFLLGAYFFDLLLNCHFIGRSLNVADDAERNGESVLIVHHGELQLQSVVKAVSVVHENVFLGDAVLAQLNHLKAEAFLHESVLVVLAEDQRLAVTHVDGVLGTSFLLVDRVVAAVVKDYAVLQNLAHRRALVLICSLEDVYGALSVGGNARAKKCPRAPKHSSAGRNGSSTVP